MSPMLLGWLEVQPVYDSARVREAIAQYEHDICRSVESKVTEHAGSPGADCIRNMRATCGPVAVDKLLRAMQNLSTSR